MRKNPQAGFTLVEILIATVITVIVMLAGAAFVGAFSKRSVAFLEGHELEETRATVAGMLRTDFDGAGRNLTRPSAPGAGKEVGVFSPVADYTSSGGTITKTGGTPGWNQCCGYLSRGLGMGTGSFQFTPPPNGGAAWLYGPNGENFSITIGFGNPSIGVWMGLYENGVERASTCCRGPSETVPPHIGGDTYAISVEYGPGSSRALRLYRLRGGVKTLLWAASMAVPPYPLGLGTIIFEPGRSFTGVTVTGAPIINLTENFTEVPQMPMDGGVRLGGPVTVAAGGQSATVLSGDRSIDAVATISPFNPSDTEVTVRAPRRGTFAAGDFVLMIDFTGTTGSAVCRVTGVSAGTGTATLTLSRVREGAKAWGRLWSTDADHSRAFPAGSQLVRLAPPVTYTTATGGRLVRMEGNRTSTLAFNARALSFAEQLLATGRSYQMSVTLAGEGFETDSNAATETRATVEYLSTPRALNLGSNQLN